MDQSQRIGDRITVKIKKINDHSHMESLIDRIRTFMLYESESKNDIVNKFFPEFSHEDIYLAYHAAKILVKDIEDKKNFP